MEDTLRPWYCPVYTVGLLYRGHTGTSNSYVGSAVFKVWGNILTYHFTVTVVTKYWGITLRLTSLFYYFHHLTILISNKRTPITILSKTVYIIIIIINFFFLFIYYFSLLNCFSRSFLSSSNCFMSDHSRNSCFARYL